MTSLKIEIATKQATRALSAIKDIIPKVNAGAINKTALDAQEAIREHMAKEFILRRAAFAKKAVKIRFAKPTKQEAMVLIDPPGGRSADVFSQYEFGGRKQAESGRLAIPTPDVRPNVRQLIRRSKRPRNLKRTFIMRDSTSGKTLIARRKSKRKLVFPYLLQTSVPITKKLKLAEITNKIVRTRFVQKWNRVYQKEIQKRFI